MSEARGVVVAHGNLAQCLVETVEGVAGSTGAFSPISNADCGPAELVDRVVAKLDGGPAVIFVDMASGSCAHAARAAARGRSDVTVITGVNLPMLLDFVFNRSLDPVELSERLRAKGSAGIAAFASGAPE
jgi:mannose/fructose-specific phosphotransferase system component IIA